MRKQKGESFRPQFDVEEVKRLAKDGKKSKFYNEAIIKEIEHRKNNSNKDYIKLRKEVREQEKTLQLITKEITDIEYLLDEYEKKLKRLRRKQAREQKELNKLSVELEKVKIIYKRTKRNNKEYSRLITENKDIINEFSKEVIIQYFNPTSEGIPDYIPNWFNKKEYMEVKETFGTFENFINKYFYNYIEKEVLGTGTYTFNHLDPNNYYTYEEQITEEEKEQIREELENKSLLDNF